MPAKNKHKADIENSSEWLYLYTKLQKRCLSIYEWINLPDSIDSFHIEKYLFEHGFACFVFDDQLGFLTLPCTGVGGINYNDEFTKYNVIYTTQPTKEYQIGDNFVLIKNNNLKIPTKTTVLYYANRLFNINRALDINIHNSKQPFIILCDQKNKFSMQQFFDNYDHGEDKIFGAKNLDLESFKVLELKSNLIANQLQEVRKEEWNEFLTDIGINNNNINKKERVLTNEVDANNQETIFNIQDGLSNRKKACEEFNKMFNKNIDVRIKVQQNSNEIINDNISNKEFANKKAGDDQNGIDENNR